ncbi:MAG: hypothetical protein WBO44_13350, partial [Saprospiraceae bacterium]
MNLRSLFLIISLLIYIGPIIIPLNAQSLFSIIPPISGGFNGHARLFNSAADSSGIFVLGEYPYYKNGDSSRYKIQNIMLRFDYYGNLIYIKNFPLTDSYNLTQYYFPLIKKNDSISYLSALYYYPGETCATNIVYEMNITTGELLKERKMPKVSICNQSYAFENGYYSKTNGRLVLPFYLNTGLQSVG